MQPGRSESPEYIELGLGNLEFGQWQARDVVVGLEQLADGSNALRVAVGSLVLAGTTERIDNIRLRCQRAAIEADRIRCHQGRASIKHAVLDAAGFDFTFDYNHSTASLAFSLSGLRFAGVSATVSASLSANDWRLFATGESFDVPRLQSLAGQYVDISALPATSGSASLTLRAHSAGRVIRVDAAQFRFADIAFDSSTGEYAADGVSGQLRLAGELTAARVQASMTAELQAGLVLALPLVIEVDDAPISLQSDFQFERASQQLVLTDFHFAHPDVVSVTGAAKLALRDIPGLLTARVDVDIPDLGRLNERYVQPLVAGSAAEGVVLQGAVSASIDYVDARLTRLSTRIQHVSVSAVQTDDSKPPDYTLDDLEGEVRWARGGIPDTSVLTWSAGSLYGLPLGGARLEVIAHDDALNLVKTFELPLLDGALLIEQLDIEGLGDGEPTLRFDGLLKPISLKQLTGKLGWPEFGGKLSGVVPGLSYKDRTLSVDGVLLMRVFDGAVTIRNLKLPGLFGALPQLEADISLNGLNLEPLTDAFSFGRIRGGLEGTISNLRLANWRPVNFDAWFTTPADDDLRHRISQDAVNNLSSIGSGISGALSMSFLRFFEEFSYKRLGIGCRLRDGLCIMRGVRDVGEGYYIVEGGGVPRIDVIGFNRLVDWQELVDRLARVTQGAGAEIQ